jgi:hypothetical protein
VSQRAAEEPGWLIAPLCTTAGLNRPLAAVCLAACVIVCWNSAVHDPAIGYDAGEHLKYVEALSTLELPGPDQTYEFFCPPLPYAFPAVLRAAGVEPRSAARAALLLNALFYAATLWSILALGRSMRIDDPTPRLAAVILLASLPVLYKSFAFLRGEPAMTAFGTLALYRAHRMIDLGERGIRHAIGLGLCLGAAMLSRQWAAFLIVAMVIHAITAPALRRGSRPGLALAVSGALVVCILTSGWFYLSLQQRFGSVAAFNRRPAPGGFSFSSQPGSFYFGLGTDRLFSDPVTPAFANRMLPVVYSETWGDYWSYWAIYGRNARNGKFLDGYSLMTFLARDPPPEWLETNRAPMGRYLGRVNAVSLLPTALMLAGLAWGIRRGASFLLGVDRSPAAGASAIAAWTVLIGLAGYLWFLVAYPVPDSGTTLKAIYLLVLFPILSLLTGEMAGCLPRRARAAALALLVLCALHNSPLFLTHFSAGPPSAPPAPRASSASRSS